VNLSIQVSEATSSESHEEHDGEEINREIIPPSGEEINIGYPFTKINLAHCNASRYALRRIELININASAPQRRIAVATEP
jgi:hypothetical protein